MDWNSLIQWLMEFIKLIQDPNVLIFMAAFMVGLVIDLYIAKWPSWTIPAVNTVIGLCAGWVMLCGTTPAAFSSHFKGALMGVTLAWAATGMHQLYEKTTEGIQGMFFKKTPPADPALPTPPKPNP